MRRTRFRFISVEAAAAYYIPEIESFLSQILSISAPAAVCPFTVPHPLYSDPPCRVKKVLLPMTEKSFVEVRLKIEVLFVSWPELLFDTGRVWILSSRQAQQHRTKNQCLSVILFQFVLTSFLLVSSTTYSNYPPFSTAVVLLINKPCCR